MNALVPEWLQGGRDGPQLPVFLSVPPVIPSAVRDLARKWLEPFVGKVPWSLRSLGMTWVVLALLGRGLVTPPPAHAQSVQPWSGRGAVPRQPAAAATRSGTGSSTAALGTGADAGRRAEQAVAAQAVAMVGLTVSDMDRSIDFYTKVLDFSQVTDDELFGEPYEVLNGVFGVRLRVVRLRLGAEYLQLTEYLASPGRPAPADAQSNDRWFQHVAIIVRDMDSAYARLRRFKVRHASTGPQRLPQTIPNAAGIRAFYFRDPDGHPLEVLQFPPDKGDPKWHATTHRLFLGIDHTAIVVADTRASLAFYRDVLGFRVVGESMNFGTEQAHLNNVPGARLHITGLRAAAGPGIEFLEYLAPRDGRPYPADERPSDLVHWQTSVVVPDVSAATKAVRRGNFHLISAAPVELPDTALGFSRGILVRDPDGHAVQLVEHEGEVHAQH
jgi:catechol 2,3-dioxygenase-like lactoylglutathione lyase family enzyme